ncbi:Histidine-containing phosphotransfer protein 1, partial [Linum perenne]
WGKGFLDSQFAQLQLLQDESNPDFVVEVVSLFFEDSDRLLDDLTKALDPQQGVDFKKVDAHVHQLKGSSSSIGAQRVKNACVAFRSFCDEQNIEGCDTLFFNFQVFFLRSYTELEISRLRTIVPMDLSVQELEMSAAGEAGVLSCEEQA